MILQVKLFQSGTLLIHLFIKYTVKKLLPLLITAA